MEFSDLELWERARAGNSDAFGLLFERHAKPIYNYCFRATGSWSTAEDLLSITFLEAWRRRDKELPDGMVAPWLFGIAVNVTRNRRRSERRLGRALSRVAASQPEPDLADRSNSRLDDEARMARVRAMLEMLPAHEREAFLLYTCLDASYEEIAFALDLPIGTVRSRLARARAHLRELESECGHKEGDNARVEALER